MKRFGTLLLVTVMVLGLLVPAMPVHAVEVTDNLPEFHNFYDQLTTAEARGIYGVLCDMLKNGDLKTGTRTVDLVAEGVYADADEPLEIIMADFSAGRDAFMFDHPAVFYVDFDKLTITVENGQVLMGVGRDTTYFRKGFDHSNVTQAIADFDNAVAAIAAQVNAQVPVETQEGAFREKTLYEKVLAAYTAVYQATSYALEKDARPENVDYVRTPYGALVRGQSVCEGYARSLKALLDAVGIKSVLVQGTYTYADRAEPHMWNFVQMDDNRWYLVDATMADGEGAKPEDFFLKDGLQEVYDPYKSSGLISLSATAFNFRYPTASLREYEPLTNAFSCEAVTDKAEWPDCKKISYRGMGLEAAEAQGLYVVTGYDGNRWYYFRRFAENAGASIGRDYALYADYETYFEDWTGQTAYYGVTDVPPSDGFDIKDAGYYTVSNDSRVWDVTKIQNAIDLVKHNPVAVRTTPNNARLDQGTTYQVEVVYSEKLMKANAAAEPELVVLSGYEGAEYTDFAWSEAKANTITFTMKTAVSYNHTVTYSFNVEGLVGLESGLAPRPVSFRVVNNPVFACPKLPNSSTIAYASTPALIADSNLAENNWTNENGGSVTGFAADRLALVAAPITNTEEAELLDKIEGENVKGAQTFDISLGLCNEQINYVSGKRLKVFVPFPEGYDASTPGVAFKAYHFKKDGTAEEIDCVTTEHGIIMMCNAFSPFAVVAVEAPEVAEKTVITSADGNGSFDLELVKVGAGGYADVTITPKEGFVLSKVTLNGVELNVSRSRSGAATITLKDEDLLESGNVLEATFALPEIKVDAVITPEISIPAGITLSGPDQWKEGTNTFTVTADRPCVVAVTHDGQTYTRLTAVQSVGTHTFTAEGMTADSSIVVTVAGDVNGDGKLTTADALRLQSAYSQKVSLTRVQTLAADLDHSGDLTIADAVKLIAVQLGKDSLVW